MTATETWCRFTAGSVYCINDPCLNPNHRTPDPTTGGNVPAPPAPAKRPVSVATQRQRRSPHCGHGRAVDQPGDTAPDCLYCDEGITPDDYWDMVRFVNAIHRAKKERAKK